MTEVWPAEVLNQIQNSGIVRLEELSSLNNRTRKVCLSVRDEASSHLSHVIRLPTFNYPLTDQTRILLCYLQQRQLASSHPSAAETCWVSVSRWTTTKKHWNKWTNKINFSFILSSFSASSNSLHVCVYKINPGICCDFIFKNHFSFSQRLLLMSV